MNSQNDHLIKSIHDSILQQNLKQFKTIIKEYGPNINDHVLIIPDSETRMNILHIMSAQELSSDGEYEWKQPMQEMLFEFISSMSQINSNFDVNYRATVENCFNMTAAHIAVQWNNKWMLEALIRYGCDLLICDCNGHNVQDYALEMKNDEIVDIVKKGIFNSIELRFLEFSSSPRESIFHYPLHEDEYYDQFNNGRFFRNNSIASLSSSASAYTTSGISEKSPTSISSIGSFSMSDHHNHYLNFSDHRNYPNHHHNPLSPIPRNISDSANIEINISPSNRSSFTASSSSSILNHCFIADSCCPTNMAHLIEDESLENGKQEDKTVIHQNAENIQEAEKAESDIKNVSFESQSSEIVYNENGLELIEERFEPVSSSNVSLNNSTSSSKSSSSSTTQQQQDECRESEIQMQINEIIIKMNDQELYEELVDRFPGVNPGPINDSTRKYYKQKYQALLQDELKEKLEEKQKQQKRIEPIVHLEDESMILAKMANYNIEFESISSRSFPFEEAMNCEEQLIAQFDHEPAGRQTHFVYLLLDPTITKNIPARVNILMNFDHQKVISNQHHKSPSSFTQMFANVLNDHTLFYRFIASIFYVGKGQSNRPYQHFIDAHREKIQFDAGQLEKCILPKTKRIWSIWEQDLGPIYLHFFSGITADEAFTREALIIETLSLFNLTNQISGTYRCHLKLNRRQKSILGTYLLFKFFIIYLLNGERQIKIPKVVKNGNHNQKNKNKRS